MNQDQNADLSQIFDLLPQQILLLNADGNVIQANKAWRKFAAYHQMQEEDWLRRPYLALLEQITQLPQTEIAAGVDALRQQGQYANRCLGEFSCRSDGQPSWFLMIAKWSSPLGIIVTHEDITAIRTPDESSKRFEQLVDASHDAILIVNQENQVDYANDAAKLLAGALPFEKGNPLVNLVDPISVAVAATDGSCRTESTLKTKDGAHIPVIQDIRRHYIGASVDNAYYTIILHDVSAEKAREEELQTRNSELQLAYSRLTSAQDQLVQSEKMASIGQLAAGVAHEINNPIGYVHSNIGILKDYARNIFSLISAYDNLLREPVVSAQDKQNIEELRQRLEIDYLTQDLPNLLQESSEGIERVRKIVQDLKDFSHAGKSDDWEFVDIHKGLDTTLNIVWNELKYKADVVKKYASLPPVECLPSQLNQVFLNILVNAGHAIRERGTIQIQTGLADLGKTIAIEISDTGVGIPEEYLQRIFDPFFTTKPVGQGTGLGLSLSYSIVKKHHGQIEVISKAGEGTTFKICLPLRQENEHAASPMEGWARA